MVTFIKRLTINSLESVDDIINETNYAIYYSFSCYQKLLVSFKIDFAVGLLLITADCLFLLQWKIFSHRLVLLILSDLVIVIKWTYEYYEWKGLNLISKKNESDLKFQEKKLNANNFSHNFKNANSGGRNNISELPYINDEELKLKVAINSHMDQQGFMEINKQFDIIVDDNLITENNEKMINCEKTDMMIPNTKNEIKDDCLGNQSSKLDKPFVIVYPEHTSESGTLHYIAKESDVDSPDIDNDNTNSLKNSVIKYFSDTISYNDINENKKLEKQIKSARNIEKIRKLNSNENTPNIIVKKEPMQYIGMNINQTKYEPYSAGIQSNEKVKRSRSYNHKKNFHPTSPKTPSSPLHFRRISNPENNLTICPMPFRRNSNPELAISPLEFRKNSNPENYIINERLKEIEDSSKDDADIEPVDDNNNIIESKEGESKLTELKNKTSLKKNDDDSDLLDSDFSKPEKNSNLYFTPPAHINRRKRQVSNSHIDQVSNSYDHAPVYKKKLSVEESSNNIAYNSSEDIENYGNVNPHYNSSKRIIEKSYANQNSKESMQYSMNASKRDSQTYSLSQMSERISGTILNTTNNNVSNNNSTEYNNMFTNIFNMVDNGLMVFDYNSMCIYNNMENFLMLNQKTQVQNFINIDLLRKHNQKFSIDKIIKNNVNIHLVSDYVNFQILIKIFNYVYTYNNSMNLGNNKLNLENLSRVIDKIKQQMFEMNNVTNGSVNDGSQLSQKSRKLGNINILLPDFTELIRNFLLIQSINNYNRKGAFQIEAGFYDNFKKPLILFYGNILINVFFQNIRDNNPILIMVFIDLSDKAETLNNKNKRLFDLQISTSFNHNIKQPTNFIYGVITAFDDDIKCNKEIVDSVKGYFLAKKNENSQVVDNKIQELENLVQWFDSVKELTEQVIRTMNYMNYIIESFVELNSIECEQMIPNILEFDLVSKMADILSIWQYEFAIKNIQYSIILDESLVELMKINGHNNLKSIVWRTDINKFCSVFIGIIENCTKHAYCDMTERNMINIIIGKVSNDVLTISVVDKGKGIDTETLEHIKDRIYSKRQAEPMLNNAMDFNLGLKKISILQKYLGWPNHKKITIESELNTGTFVTFYQKYVEDDQIWKEACLDISRKDCGSMISEQFPEAIDQNKKSVYSTDSRFENKSESASIPYKLYNDQLKAFRLTNTVQSKSISNGTNTKKIGTNSDQNSIISGEKFKTNSNSQSNGNNTKRNLTKSDQNSIISGDKPYSQHSAFSKDKNNSFSRKSDSLKLDSKNSFKNFSNGEDEQVPFDCRSSLYLREASADTPQFDKKSNLMTNSDRSDYHINKDKLNLLQSELENIIEEDEDNITVYNKVSDINNRGVNSLMANCRISNKFIENKKEETLFDRTPNCTQRPHDNTEKRFANTTQTKYATNKNEDDNSIIETEKKIRKSITLKGVTGNYYIQVNRNCIESINSSGYNETFKYYFSK